jgi:hypothetical protein
VAGVCAHRVKVTISLDRGEMNLFLVMDNELDDAAQLLDTFYGIHDLTYVGELSSCVNLPDTNVSVIGNFMNEPVMED